MSKDQILKLLRERRDHYSLQMSKCSLDPDKPDLLNSATGSWFALSEAIRMIEPKNEMRARMIKELTDKCIEENGSLFCDGAKGFWDQIKAMQNE